MSTEMPREPQVQIASIVIGQTDVAAFVTAMMVASVVALGAIAVALATVVALAAGGLRFGCRKKFARSRTSPVRPPNDL